MAVMPPNVAAGELIESAWGNQVVGKLAELWSLDVQGDQTVLSTNASGAFAFTFPAAFATAPKTVQFTTGDMARAAAIITVNATTTTAAGCDGVIWDGASNAIVASGLVRVYWLAVGLRA